MYAYPLLDEWEHPCRREAKAITIRSSNTENCDNLDLAASLFSLPNSQTVCTRSRMSPPPQAGYGNWKFEWPLPKMSAPHLPPGAPESRSMPSVPDCVRYRSFDFSTITSVP